MKKNFFKRMVAVSSAIVTLACGSSLLALNASAATFITGTGINGDISVNQSQIPVTVSYIRDSGSAMRLTYNGSDRNLHFEQCSASILGRYKVKFTVQDSSLTKSSLENSLKIMVSAKNADRTKWGAERDFPVSVVSTGNNTFQVESHIIAYGTTLNIWTKDVQFSSNTKISATSISGENSDYRLIKTNVSGAENVYALVPKQAVLANGTKQTITTVNYEKWAKRMCTYLNSLANVTGLHKGYTYISFNNDFEPGAGCSDKDAYSQYDDNATCIVSYKTDYSKNTVQNIYYGRNYMEWIELHELSHCYRYQVVNNRSNDFSAYYWPGSDETTTNVRGLTALQNCTNLKNVQVVFGNNIGTYATILNKTMASGEKHHLFKFADSLVDFALSRGDGWDILEHYFKGTNAKKMNEFSPSSLAAFQEYTGIKVANGADVEGGTKRYVNSLCFLYMYSWGKTTFNKYEFKSFLSQMANYGLTVANIQEYVTWECNEDLGDINNDGEINAQDYNLLRNYILNTQSLSYAEQLRADMDKNGTLNAFDSILLKAKILNN